MCCVLCAVRSSQSRKGSDVSLECYPTDKTGRHEGLIPSRHEWLEMIGGRYVSALLAASRGGSGRLARLARCWGRVLTWQQSQGAHSMEEWPGHEGGFCRSCMWCAE